MRTRVCILRYSKAERARQQPATHAHALLRTSAVRRGVKQLLRCVVVGAVVGWLIPTMTGLLCELVFVTPVQVPANETAVFHLLQVRTFLG